VGALVEQALAPRALPAHAPPGRAPAATEGEAGTSAPAIEGPGLSGGPAAAAVAEVPIRPPWAPPDVPRRPFSHAIERWRPLVRELLAEAWEEGRLEGPAAALDDDLVLALIQHESAGDPEAVSPAGALGLMQVMPFTFAEMMAGSRALADQIDRAAMFDVPSNVRAGLRYLALAMQAHEGNLYWALAAYNAGIEAVADWRAAGLYAVPPIGGYVETAHYAPAILRTYLRHRPGLHLYVPPIMPAEHVPGAIELLKAAGRW
jgi:soluble lytic murein transglycosylase-like protein